MNQDATLAPIDIAREAARAIREQALAGPFVFHTGRVEGIILTAIQRGANVELEKRRAAEAWIEELESDVRLYKQSWKRLAEKALAADTAKSCKEALQ